MACVTSGFTCHKCFCTRTNTTANMCVFAVKLCKFYYRRKSSESLERQRRRWQHQQAATREKKKTLFVCLSLRHCRRSVRACVCMCLATIYLHPCHRSSHSHTGPSRNFVPRFQIFVFPYFARHFCVTASSARTIHPSYGRLKPKQRRHSTDEGTGENLSNDQVPRPYSFVHVHRNIITFDTTIYAKIAFHRWIAVVFTPFALTLTHSHTLARGPHPKRL